MTQSEAISHYQPFLQSIAVKIVGSIHDAEDIVQDTFLKWLSVEKEKIENTKSYLTRAVINNCINHINALNQKKKEYLENLSQSALVSKYKDLDLRHLDFEKEVSTALDVLHEKLAPVERAVFLLKEVFNLEYEELKEVVNKKKDNCRQLFRRANQKLSETRPGSGVVVGQSSIIDQFIAACKTGNLSELISRLQADISAKS